MRPKPPGELTKLLQEWQRGRERRDHSLRATEGLTEKRRA